ncbi:SCF ubiquitin ligase complex protein SKP1b [Diplonema papillatum]|nr:SCF ubiquitin ligase complex protein SKP1b [Diplonema papillatum]
MSQVLLIASDGTRHTTTKEACAMSKTLHQVLEEIGDGPAEVPVSNVRGDVLAQIISYMEAHHNHRAPDLERPLKRNLLELLSEWDRRFVKQNNHKQMVIDLISGANILGIKDLLDLGCAIMAEKMKTMSVDQVRDVFGVVNDFSKEEEEKIRIENNVN